MPISASLRGGVLGAMDTMYQRSKESHAEGGETELMRSTGEEKVQQVKNVAVYRSAHGDEAQPLLSRLQGSAQERRLSVTISPGAGQDFLVIDIPIFGIMETG